MSCWSKQELENMLEDVVNELDLSETAIEKHGPLGTPPAELVQIVLAEKDAKIRMLQSGFVEITGNPQDATLQTELKKLRDGLGEAINLIQSYGSHGPVMKAKLSALRALLSPDTNEPKDKDDADRN